MNGGILPEYASDPREAELAADGVRVYHASDEHGTRDLMVFDRRTGDARRVSGLLGGVDSPRRPANRPMPKRSWWSPTATSRF